MRCSQHGFRLLQSLWCFLPLLFDCSLECHAESAVWLILVLDEYHRHPTMPRHTLRVSATAPGCARPVGLKYVKLGSGP